MKRVKYISVMAAAVVMAVAAGSVTAAPAVTITSDIANTKHNLSTGQAATFNRTTDGTTEICVFCHTPHGADTSQAVPLWNRAMTTPASFTTYDTLGSSTLDGTITAVGSVSLACLSCHDGQITMDSLINMPGSGAGSGTADTDVGLGWTFATGSAAGTTMTAAGKLDVGIANIGLDLSDDHPVGILYAGGNVAGNEGAPLSYKDPDFVQATPVTINGGNYWYVDTDANGQRTRVDMILYTRSDVNGTPQPFVECASCHDPHVIASDADQVMFLRMSNTGSELCLACHIK